MYVTDLTGFSDQKSVITTLCEKGMWFTTIFFASVFYVHINNFPVRGPILLLCSKFH